MRVWIAHFDFAGKESAKGDTTRPGKNAISTDFGTFVVADPIEVPSAVNANSFDVDGSTLTVTALFNGVTGDRPFNGLIFRDELDVIPDFISATVDSSTYGIANAFFGTDFVGVRFDRGSRIAGQQIVISFETAMTPVPLPAGGLLLLSGLGAIAFRKWARLTPSPN